MKTKSPKSSIQNSQKIIITDTNKNQKVQQPVDYECNKMRKIVLIQFMITKIYKTIMYINKYKYLPNPSAQARCNKVNFQAKFNKFEFNFPFETGCYTKFKEPVCPTIYS